MSETNVYKENYELKKEIEAMRDAFSDIAKSIVCIGGPLNDNSLKYTPKQLRIFREIRSIAMYFMGASND